MDVIDPSGVSHALRPVLRSIATSAPNGGGVHGSREGASNKRRLMTVRRPSHHVVFEIVAEACLFVARVRCAISNPSRGMSCTISGDAVHGDDGDLSHGVDGHAPQFAPPIRAGISSVPCVLGGVKMPSFRNGAMTARHAARSASVMPQI